MLALSLGILDPSLLPIPTANLENADPFSSFPEFDTSLGLSNVPFEGQELSLLERVFIVGLTFAFFKFVGFEIVLALIED